jgi:hypothetical protein
MPGPQKINWGRTSRNHASRAKNGKDKQNIHSNKSLRIVLTTFVGIETGFGRGKKRNLSVLNDTRLSALRQTLSKNKQNPREMARGWSVALQEEGLEAL